MASPRAANPGPTARFYRKNKKSREKHNRDNNKGGKYDKTAEYTRWHSARRRSLGIMGEGGKDVTKNGTESVKTNRGRGGAKRK
tara:strand:- start:194 stop:445 length:252 start_codon:yes stop_codon:yes gene_type:complete